MTINMQIQLSIRGHYVDRVAETLRRKSSNVLEAGMASVRGTPSANRSAVTTSPGGQPDVCFHARNLHARRHTCLLLVRPRVVPGSRTSSGIRRSKRFESANTAAGPSRRDSRSHNLSLGDPCGPAGAQFLPTNGCSWAMVTARQPFASARRPATASAAAAGAAVTALQQPQMLTWTIICLAAAAAQVISMP